MKDYDHINHATDKRLAELLEPIGLDLGASGNLEACAIVGEAARRLKAYQPREVFNHEAFE